MEFEQKDFFNELLAQFHRHILTIESYYEYDTIDYRFSKDYAKTFEYPTNNKN